MRVGLGQRTSDAWLKPHPLLTDLALKVITCAPPGRQAPLP